MAGGDTTLRARSCVHWENGGVLVVGNRKEFDKPLSSLGPVKEIDITIPPPPGAKEEKVEKPTASDEEGKALAAKVVAALGGRARVAPRKALQAHAPLTDKRQRGSSLPRI